MIEAAPERAAGCYMIENRWRRGREVRAEAVREEGDR